MYAKWIPLYTITVNNVSNGIVTASKTNNITAGSIITLTVTPNTDYELTNLVIKNGSIDVNKEIVIEGAEYTFVMPSGNVIITASFMPISIHNVDNVEVGDVVLCNGMYVAYSAFLARPAIYLSISQPAGVVAYKGITGSYGITGKVYMVGLTQGFLMWKSENVNKEFVTSNTAGESNWAVITAKDPNGSADAATNYPAFNYANTYGVTGYSSGWFIPSIYELAKLYENTNAINDTISTIIGAGVVSTKLSSNSCYWSSHYVRGTGGDIAFIDFSDGRLTRDSSSVCHSVVVVRALEE